MDGLFSGSDGSVADQSEHDLMPTEGILGIGPSHSLRRITESIEEAFDAVGNLKIIWLRHFFRDHD
ncbi:MAG: hypothetical protein ACK58T_40960 [Phycisphaerae bacterium]